MRNSTSERLAWCHATMVCVTTPETPRALWPAHKFRMDDETWQTIRVKLATDDETWQGVMETFARSWLANLPDADVSKHREELKARGLMP